MVLMRLLLFSTLLVLACFPAFNQQIHLVNKLDGTKIKSIRMDNRITVKTFEGEKFSGEWQVLDANKILVQGKEVEKADVMMISGFIKPHSSDRALGLGLTIGAGIVFPVAVYYILGGIAWGFPNGVFVGATVLAFDLLLAYAGTAMMGIMPRRFSTLNWEITLSTAPAPIRLPVPVD
jgi:hypothetical protein